VLPVPTTEEKRRGRGAPWAARGDAGVVPRGGEGRLNGVRRCSWCGHEMSLLPCKSVWLLVPGDEKKNIFNILKYIKISKKYKIHKKISNQHPPRFAEPFTAQAPVTASVHHASPIAGPAPCPAPGGFRCPFPALWCISDMLLQWECPH